MGKSEYHCSSKSIVLDLLTYGEEELAKDLKASPKETYQEIKDRVLDIACAPEYARKDGSSMLLCKACAMAAIEVLEGERREPKFKRRNFARAKKRYREIRTPTEKAVSLSLKLAIAIAVSLILFLILK